MATFQAKGPQADPSDLLRRSLIAGGSSRHLSLSDGMAFPVIDRHEPRVFLPVPWFSPRSRHRSPHHGVRKLRGLNVTGAVRFDRTGIHGVTRNHPPLRPGKGQGDRWITNGSWRWSWRSSG